MNYQESLIQQISIHLKIREEILSGEDTESNLQEIEREIAEYNQKYTGFKKGEVLEDESGTEWVFIDGFTVVRFEYVFGERIKKLVPSTWKRQDKTPPSEMVSSPIHFTIGYLEACINHNGNIDRLYSDLRRISDYLKRLDKD